MPSPMFHQESHMIFYSSRFVNHNILFNLIQPNHAPKFCLHSHDFKVWLIQLCFSKQVSKYSIKFRRLVLQANVLCLWWYNFYLNVVNIFVQYILGCGSVLSSKSQLSAALCPYSVGAHTPLPQYPSGVWRLPVLSRSKSWKKINL